MDEQTTSIDRQTNIYYYSIMPTAKDTKKKSAQDRAALIEQINIPQLTENLFDSSSRGNQTTLAELLTIPTKTVENLRFEAIQQHHLLQVRNDQTRTCLDLAAMLGHHESVKILAERGANMMTNGLNVANGAGYSSLHLACVWNQLEAVKHLIASGADIDMKTMHGEEPVDIARRYHHEQLVNYLEWIAIRNSLTRLINDAKEFLADPAKNMNKMNKDEKKKLEKYIAESSKWFDDNQNAPNASELFTSRIQETEAFFAPFYANAAAAETDTTNTNRTQLGTPKSGRK